MSPRPLRLTPADPMLTPLRTRTALAIQAINQNDNDAQARAARRNGTGDPDNDRPTSSLSNSPSRYASPSPSAAAPVKGAYEAGLNWALLQFAASTGDELNPLGGKSRGFEAASFAGASAGGINSLLSGLTWCLRPDNEAGIGNHVDDNFFRSVWLKPDVNHLLPPARQLRIVSARRRATVTSRYRRRCRGPASELARAGVSSGLPDSAGGDRDPGRAGATAGRRSRRAEPALLHPVRARGKRRRNGRVLIRPERLRSIAGSGDDPDPDAGHRRSKRDQRRPGAGRHAHQRGVSVGIRAQTADLLPVEQHYRRCQEHRREQRDVCRLGVPALPRRLPAVEGRVCRRRPVRQPPGGHRPGYWRSSTTPRPPCPSCTSTSIRIAGGSRRRLHQTRAKAPMPASPAIPWSTVSVRRAG